MTEQPVTTPPAAPAPAPEPAPRRRQAGPKPEPKARRSASWAPDPRWAHPVEFTLWIYVAGYIPTVLGVPAAAVLAVGLLAGLAGAVRARAAFPRVDYGDQLPVQMSVLSVAAGVAGAVWLWHAATIGPIPALGWLIIAAVPLGLVYAVLRSSAPKWQAAVTEIEERRAAEHAQQTWDRIFADVGLKLRVVDVRDTRAGQAIGVSPSGEQAVTFDSLRAKIPDITSRAAMLLGREGITIGDGDIVAEATEASHVHVLHVRSKKVLEESIPFVPLGHPATGQDPVDTALYEDGREVEVALVGPAGGTHSFVVGATGSGKTTTVAAIVGRYAETVDVIQGVIATDKLVPFVWPWLRPWAAGRTERPAIDFVAGQKPEHVMEMLAGLYRLVRDRNTRLPDSGLFEISAAEPGIILWVEETKDAIDRCRRIEVDGRMMSYSALVDGITRAGRSAQVALQQLNQFGLVDAYGDHGSEIFRNVTLRIVLRTMTSYDGAAMLPGLVGARADTTKLRHHSMLFQPSTDEPRVMPAKGYAFAEGQIGEHAAAVAGHRPELGEHEAGVIGEPWARRWDGERVPELVAKAMNEGLGWTVEARPAVDEEDRVTGVEDEMDRELREMLGGRPEPTPAEPEGFPSADDAIAEMGEISGRAGRPTLPEPLDAVMRLLEERDAPTDFVSTRQLAVLLGRVERDADEEAIDAAAVELGRQLAEVDAELRTRQRRQKGAGRSRGYDVADLRRVAARIARGGQ